MKHICEYEGCKKEYECKTQYCSPKCGVYARRGNPKLTVGVPITKPEEVLEQLQEKFSDRLILTTKSKNGQCGHLRKMCVVCHRGQGKKRK